MRPFALVVDAPRLDRALRVVEADQPVLVQAFVAACAVEALDERILRRLPRIDEIQHHPVRVRPGIERRAGELGPVVADDRARIPAYLRDAIEHARHPLARQREVHLDHRALTRAIVHERERPKHPPIAERVAHKIHAPPLVRPRRGGHRRPRHHGAAPALTASHLQAFFLIHALHALVIDVLAFTPQDAAQLPIALPPAARGEFMQPCAQLGVGRPPRLVPLRRPREARVPTRAPLGDLGGGHRARDGRPPVLGR